MKKQIALITILALSLTGCGSANATATQTDSGEAAGAPTQATGQKPSDQKPGEARGKMVRGQIQDVLANDVKLALIEMPKRVEGATDGEVAEKRKNTAPNGDAMGGPPGMGQQAREVKLTGETLGIQIPVGVPITTRGQSGETTLQLSDLTKGDILNVQYDTDGVTIIKVNVTSGSTQ